MDNKHYINLYITVFLLILTILLIPVSALVVNDVINQRHQHLEKYNKEQVQLASTLDEIIESRFLDLKTATLSLQKDDLIIESMKGYSTDSWELNNETPDLFQRLKVISKIESYFGVIPIANEIVTISKYKDIVITSSGWYRKEEYLSTFYPSHKYNFYEIDEKNLLPVNIMFKCDNPDCSNLYCKHNIALSFSMYGTNSPFDVIFIVDKRFFSSYVNRINNYSFKHLEILLNDIVLYENSNTNASYDYEYISSNTNLIIKHAFFEPSTYFLSEHNFIIFTIIIIFCFILSLILSFYLSSPIHRIFVKLSNNLHARHLSVSDRKFLRNAAKIFENYIDDMVTSQDMMSKTIIKYRNMISNDDMLLNILLANNVEEFLDEIIGMWPWFSEEKFYSLVLINFEADNKNIKNEIVHDLENVLKQLSENKSFEYFLMSILFNHCVLILSYYNIPNNELFKDIKKHICTIMNDNNVFFGSVERGVLGIQTSYQQAKEKQQNYLKNTSKMIDGYFFPISHELQLINSIKSANPEKSKQILNEIFYQNEKSNLTKTQYNKLYLMLFDIFVRYAKENNYDISEYKERVLSSLHENTKQTLNIMISLCEDISKFIQYKYDEELNDLSQKIFDYINQNFDDPNICVNNIAEKFDISRSTVSKIINNTAGVSFTDLINKLRIDKVLSLMELNQYSLSDLSKMAGFYSYCTFKRVFIKNTGIVPSEYKNLYVK